MQYDVRWLRRRLVLRSSVLAGSCRRLGSGCHAQPTRNATVRSRVQKIIAGAGLKARVAGAQTSFGQSPHIAVGYGVLSDVALNSAESLPQTRSSQTTATASRQLSIDLPLHCSFPPIPTIPLHHTHSHHARHITHRAASGCDQAVHRQGWCSRRLGMVERAPGPSRESIALNLMKPELD